MANYLLIESRDPFENGEVLNDYEIAVNLAESGHHVTFFLVQNGVLPVRNTVNNIAFANLMNSNVEILADDFSLRERGISGAQMMEEVRMAPIDMVVDRLADGHKAIWL